MIRAQSRSLQTSVPDFDRSPKVRIDRFKRLDAEHIEALESVLDAFPILKGRMEVHLPGHRAKQIFQSDTVWVWPKFDRRPASFLVFIDGFAPCMWDATRQEGYTLRWILPPNFCSRGPIICLANLLKGESVLQIEDLLVYGGRDLWSSLRFSARWEELRRVWATVPSEQPLLALQPRIVKPIALEAWSESYDASLSWIIQSDCARGPRWFWWDSVTPVDHKPYHAPALKRSPDIAINICAICKPYLNLGLPDAYTLYSQEGTQIGIASIRSLAMSQELKNTSITATDGIPVKVEWNDEFRKYQIVAILPDDNPVSPISFFPHAQ